MKAKQLYILLAAFLVMLGAPSCSDNVDGELKPTANERLLSIETEGKSTSDNATAQPIKFDFDSGSKSILVKVTSNTLWKVEVSGDGGCSVDVARGRGNGEFNITVPNNRGEQRYSQISVTQIDGDGNEYTSGRSAYIEITQEGSQVYITPSSLDMFPAEDARDQEFDIVANAEWTLSVRAESEGTGNFITITPLDGMTEVSGSSQVFTGTANARFRISLQNNGTAVVRKAYIELKSENGNSSVEISQQKSDYTFDVSPNNTRYIAAVGDDFKFEVYSPMYGWHIILPEDSWISCPNKQFDKSDSRVTVNMNVPTNFTGRERTETIYFESDYSAYDRVPVMVVQAGYDMTFAISSADASEVVMENGGSLSFDLDSRFNWIIETPTWVSASDTKGNASTSARRIDLKIGQNTTNSYRSGNVTVYPESTVFEEGVTLDPAKLGIQPVRFSVTQFGGQKPAISVPWLSDGVTQKEAELSFNYYSPYIDIAYAGLEWKEENATDWETQQVSVSDVKSGTVMFKLSGLKPMQGYVARGYVITSDGQTYPGKTMLTFNTAGQLPGINDNPTPTK